MKTQLSILALFVLLTGCQQEFEDTTPIRKDVTETVFASGKLAARGTYNLIAKADGYLVAMDFEAGDIVAQGTVLAVIDNEETRVNNEGSEELLAIAESNASNTSPALRQAQVSIEIAEAQYAQDSLQAARYATLWAQNSVARVDYERAQLTAQNAKKNLEAAFETRSQLERDAEQQLINSRMNFELSSESMKQVAVRAVVPGKVYQKYKEVGDYVSRGTVIATIGHPTDIYAEVQIDESAIADVKVGQPAIVQLNTNPDQPIQAVVSEILPTFNDASQSFTSRLTFLDPLKFQIVGTQLQSNIIVEQVDNALLIPRKYLDFNGNVQLKATGEKVPVTTKTISSDWVQVIDGIDEETALTVAIN